MNPSLPSDLQLVYRPIDQLIPYSQNPRKNDHAAGRLGADDGVDQGIRIQDSDSGDQSRRCRRWTSAVEGRPEAEARVRSRYSL